MAFTAARTPSVHAPVDAGAYAKKDSTVTSSSQCTGRGVVTPAVPSTSA
jgi:hypothetical protein